MIGIEQRGVEIEAYSSSQGRFVLLLCGQLSVIINPGAAWVTLVGFVCLAVCLSVSQYLTSQMSNRAINERANSVACECRKICGDFLKQQCSRDMPRNTSKKANILITLAYLW